LHWAKDRRPRLGTWGGPRRIKKGEYALGVWCGWVRLAINTLLVKGRRLVGIEEGKNPLQD